MGSKGKTFVSIFWQKTGTALATNFLFDFQSQILTFYPKIGIFYQNMGLFIKQMGLFIQELGLLYIIKLLQFYFTTQGLIHPLANILHIESNLAHSQTCPNGHHL